MMPLDSRMIPHGVRPGTRLLLLLCLPLLALGCKPDESPLINKNKQLREQIGKLESIIASLQDGNKVMQDQINLLNEELRQSKKETETVAADLKAQATKLSVQISKNRTLTAENRRLAERHARAIPTLQVHTKGGQTEEFAQSIKVVGAAIEKALAQNGYTLQMSVTTENTSVFVTTRKVSPPSSLEQTGFRNQYVVSLKQLPSKKSRVDVKADFEKVAQGNRALAAGPEETAEIERRLIAEIGKALKAKGKV
jgi:hypothetical protein